MGDHENSLIKLQDLSACLEEGSFDDNMRQLAAISAKVLNAENCSLMLLSDDDMEK